MKDIKFAWICRNIHFDEVKRVELTDAMLISLSYPSWIKSRNCEVLAKIFPTGAVDKAGVDVWEGDKLLFVSEDEGNNFIEIVKWSDEMLGWCLYDDKDDKEPIEPLGDQVGGDFEIIGNIYQPELMK